MFLEAVDHHPRANILYDPSHFVLQQLDYLAFIDRYHDRIKMFHVKDAEFNPSANKVFIAVIKTGQTVQVDSVH
ncbi:inosose isomerase [Vibrio astriarenae]|nr:inosose isomerase [Vibrio sp. C7]